MKKLTLKVTEKGCIGLYGIRRFPMAFYPQEWDKVATMMEAIKEFEEEHRSELTYKENKDD